MAYPYLTDVLRSLGVDVSLPIPMFGLFVGIAFLVGNWLADREARRLAPDQPPDLMSTACLVGFITGLAGAKLFHALEYPREFAADPIGMLVSPGGFTIFGGLIVGIPVAVMYVRRKRAPLPPLFDAVAPALMLAYGIGRIGCQIAGDGDWGVAVTGPPPAWLPDWLWAQTYENNIAGVEIAPPGVYPTPLYETLMAFAAFGILWRLRLHRHAPGWLFGVYLLLAGVERLLIEHIRVNATYSLFGMQITQAQIIATACVVAGLVVMWWRRSNPAPAPI